MADAQAPLEVHAVTKSSGAAGQGVSCPPCPAAHAGVALAAGRAAGKPTGFTARNIDRSDA